MKSQLNHYIRKFSKLRVDKTKGLAPHKPIMLLSIIDLIEKGEITKNEIVPSVKITETFLKYWAELNIVTHNPTLHLPFYHLSSEGFWHLTPNVGHEIALMNIKTVKTFSQLKNVVHHAALADDLFTLLQEKNNRDIFRKVILDIYFSGAVDYDQHDEFKHLSSISLPISVAEGPVQYHSGRKEISEEIRRSLTFRNEIMALYDHTCSMCMKKLISLNGVTIVDAAHIIPFHESHDDNISNGFSLCKNHHWIFDRGLISVDEDYCVLISSEIESNSIASVDLEVGHIMLPKLEKNNPSHESFEWHRKHILQ